MAYFNNFSKERWDLVAKHIASNHQQGHIVIINPGYLKKALIYYVDKKKTPITIESFPENNNAINYNNIQKLKDYSHQRVWLVKAHSSDPNNLLNQSLEHEMALKMFNYFRRTGFSLDCETDKCIGLYLFEPIS